MQAQTEGITRERLDRAVRRFAQRFTAKTTQFYRETLAGDLTPEERYRVTLVQLEVNRAAVKIAIGENAVTNMLDMLVLTRMAHKVAERQAQGFYGVARGTQLIEITRGLEVDGWELSERVLTKPQLAQLRAKIDDWLERNPDQYLVYQVRFASFLEFEGTDLADVQQTGGLVAQFTRTLDTAEEFRHFGERLLFYLDFAPSLSALQAQATIYELLRQPEVQDSVRQASSVAQTIERLPDSRLEFVDQLLQGIAAERTALFAGIAAERAALLADIGAEQASLGKLLTDAKPVVEATVALTANLNEMMQSVERTTTAVNLDLSGGGEPTDINTYRQLVNDSSAGVVELRQLVQSIEALTRSDVIHQSVPPMFQSVRDESLYFLHRFFLLIELMFVVTILSFFVALFFYRHARHRYHGPSQSSTRRSQVAAGTGRRQTTEQP